uniref:anti-phage protein KwaA n=1 Tax=Candidatus Cryptobacteroides bacterium TaxID=3085639 RepID=UPI004026B9A3
MLRKIGLYIQSLSLLFIVLIVLTIGVPSSDGVSDETDIIGIIVPIVCGIALFVGFVSFIDFFCFEIKGTRHLSVKIIKIEDIGYEPQTFISTYIIPLAFIGVNSVRNMIALLIMLIAIGVIFLKTNIFYANPTLSLLGYKLYKVSCHMRNGEDHTGVIIISRCILSVGDNIRYIELGEDVYYAYKTI